MRFKSISNIYYELDVDSNESVYCVKIKLAKKINSTQNNIELIFKCMVLEDDCIINNFNILPDDMILFSLNNKDSSDIYQTENSNSSHICQCGNFEGQTCKFRQIFVYIANFEKGIIYKVQDVAGKKIKDAILNSNFKNIGSDSRLYYNKSLIEVDMDFIHYGIRNGDLLIQNCLKSTVSPEKFNEIDSSNYHLFGFNSKDNPENIWINFISKTHDFVILQQIEFIKIPNLIEKISGEFEIPKTQVKLFKDRDMTTEATESDLNVIIAGKSWKKFWMKTSDSTNLARERRRSSFQYSIDIYFSLVASFENLILQEVIGKGAYGIVYRCIDVESGRTFALKKFKILSTIDTAECEALKQEIDILCSIGSNPRIVNFERKIIVDDSLCLLMEYAPQGSLRMYLNKNGPLEETRIATFTRQILEALKYLHGHKVIHRDVKGDNVLLDHDCNVKLGDFGLSKSFKGLVGTETFNRGAAKSFVGTFNYMAPEVITGQEYGSQADIWSLGATIVEMLTGKPPFHNSEPFHVIFKVGISKKLEFNWPVNVSEALRDFVDCCLKAEPSERLTVDKLLEHPFLKEN